VSSTAKRLRGSPDPASEIRALATVVCGNCGQRFAISSKPATEDAALAEKQMAWVADKLVWDHIQERKHQGSMELPSLT
jgi:transcription elongation factor Elf1